MFRVPPQTVAGWSTLTTSPYLDIFIGKFNQMEQAGIMDRLHHQYQVSKPMEPEVWVINLKNWFHFPNSQNLYLFIVKFAFVSSC